ncbi:HK97 gp10 family phage protein [Bacillus thuringiensis]|uniref:HK97 gp10 family phage protein n=1 Tax=Bacillus thuringiensis TaxID=1428 RepID=UPI0026E2FF6E|nr:HK97 gp10 family phage protein [Bacillus thuringiensis]MDO6631767.1 HK97 gp10 family phage protein [Bacillus thuringiensis]MDO6661402.1 HK97 gp10 family phage protein [Bacillus thuringiensis]MDO6701907.1 HK97 gp10 family phage protein [Bacillus thuringiensis]
MVRIDDLAAEITKHMQQYTSEVEEGVEKAQMEVAKEGVKTLQGVNHPKLTGKYRKSWRAKKTEEGVVIHNAKHYQRTHLLEKGHAKANGTGRVPGIPHIRPVEQKANEEYRKRVEKVVKR